MDDTNEENLGEIHAHFTPQHGVQDMHRFYPRFECLIYLIDFFTFSFLEHIKPIFKQLRKNEQIKNLIMIF